MKKHRFTAREIERLLVQEKDRRLPTILEKVSYLHIDYDIPFRLVARTCNLNPGRVVRAVAAIRKGRRPGVVGHPPRLTFDEEQSVLDRIAALRENRVKVDYRVVQSIVCLVHLLHAHSFGRVKEF